MDLYNFLNSADSSFSYQRSFNFAGIRFCMFTEEKAAIDEIEQYISPTYNEKESLVEKSVEVRFIINQSMENMIRDLCSKDGEIITAKTDITYKKIKKDGMILYCSDLGEKPHSIVIYDGKFAVIGASHSVSSIRGPLRVIREVALRKLENQGGCFTHAAAVAFDQGETGALIIGNSGAGKSSIMWHLLMHGNADFITNDRSISLLENDQLHVFGWPMCLRLGMGMVRATTDVNELQKRTYSREQAKGLWEQEVNNEVVAKKNWGNKDKLEITPVEASEITGAKVRSRTVVNVLFFPQLKIGTGKIRLIPANDRKAEEILHDNIREPADEDYGKGWLDQRKVSDAFLIERSNAIIKHFSKLPRFYIVGDPRYLSEVTTELLAWTKSESWSI
ncbi:hypothetical protein A9498_30360 (plasmid) [Bacillus thuringiensis serovar coreanensis]|uniref:hypothetical protein n=1 Tax=Bacillus TaxID=1386 RepID=UPI0007F0B319|nr:MULTISPECIES: hypothetical protein [Bacillus]ANN35684.1 hypothetical protein A9498_30360 [Bacillus thuringiensis serovar coreanensis]PFX72050.1 hypothetical protein COL39_20590 [Bacillus cereus]PRP92091.1 hypothetical protein TUN_50440 [Bacillus sp. M21]